MHAVLGLSPRLLQAVARVLVLALGVAAFGPMLHGVHADDCDPPVVWHDASQHRVQAVPTSGSDAPADDHCVACHFARASRGLASWEPSGLTVLADGVILYHADGRLVAAPSASPQPARAPPLV